MSKKYWHTWTLFLQNWKYYKWSYKFDYCIECKNCDSKHKWNWLCTSCWDKNRQNNARRKITRKIAWIRFSYRRRVLHRLITKQRIYKKLDPDILKENRNKTIQKWIDKNREVINLQNKVYRRKRKWLPCLKIIINWKDRFLPFESLEKPATVFQNPKYDKWKKEQKEYDILINYYKNAWKKMS